MKRFNYFTLMMLALVAATGCNEKISPKLLEGNQSTTVPPIIEPEEYFLKVTNTSPSIRKFHLHQSGAGNYAKKCEVRSTDKFSSSLFRDPSRRAEFDISCIFEAEELSLQHGFSFSFEASPNTCEYVTYAPFSYFNFKPGDSSGSLTQVSCTEGTSAANIIAVAGAGALPESAAGPDSVGCGQMVDNAFADNVRQVFAAPTDDETLCRYNYSRNDGPNCDIGTITVTNHEYSYTPAQDANPATLGYSVSTRQIRCGGKVGNCIEGPMKTHNPPADATTFLIYHETVKNQAFSKNEEYKSILSSAHQNYYYANFRRNLANPHIDYNILTGNLVNYVDAFTGMTEIFATLMENYSNNKLYNNATTVPGTDPYLDSIPNTRRTRALASEPFMGLAGYKTNPYYTIYCLDAAEEMKGRIKIMVRDWDRFFSTNQATFDLITDADQYDNARIDNLTDPGELPEDGDVLNPLNDRADWDDLIPMNRTVGPLSPNTTTWEPERGFFHNGNFPRVILEN